MYALQKLSNGLGKEKEYSEKNNVGRECLLEGVPGCRYLIVGTEERKT